MFVFCDTLAPGKPYPLGASWDGLGTNFAVFSAHARKIELCLFDPSGRKEIKRLPLPECTQHVWHGYLPEAHPGLLYGYRAFGPYQPAQGHFFNPHKLLIDPYTRQLQGSLRWSDALLGYRPGAGNLADRRDSAPAMPKSVVTDGAFDWGNDRRPEIPWDRTLIYEVHVRGFSQLRADLHTPLHGTIAAMATPESIDHFQRLGVTTLELMPIQAYLQDRPLVQRGLSNYWGYSPLAYFTPEASYLGPGGPDELRRAIRRLHLAGIEIILDVVFNHTCEWDETGPTLSLRGLDNASYYRLTDEPARRFVNYTGCGNTLNLAHPRVQQLVLDSLRYWASEFHVDGFRFDLCTTLGRDGNGFDRGAAFFDALAQDPLLNRLKLISEPWDLGPDGYQLGRQPPIMAEWNDRYRDSVRRFWRADNGERAEFARRLCASADVFDADARKPWASIQFVTAHDGFTLEDLVSYQNKHNEANGEKNHDGSDNNYSANWGVEGPSDDAKIRQVRDKVKRAMLASLLFSNGTPMMLAGDEWGNSQGGNNNAYCQDNPVGWLDWAALGTSAGAAMMRFCTRAAALRRDYRVFNNPHFPHGLTEPLPGVLDADWFDIDGRRMPREVWEDSRGHTLALRRAGPSWPTPRATAADTIDVTLMLCNAGATHCRFTLPAPAFQWRLMLDTANPDAAVTQIDGHASVDVASHSLVLLISTVAMPAPAV